MAHNNFNYDSLTILVDHIADYLVSEAVNPNYILIRKLLAQDNIKDHRDFADKFGAHGFKKFQTLFINASNK